MTRMLDKVCIVTGAASGIGAATSRRLAEEGGHVLMTDIDGETGMAAASELARRGLSVRFQPHDVTRRDEWEAAIAAAKTFSGRLDVVVNNAGLAIPGSIEEADIVGWRKVLDVNLDGVFHGVQLGVRELKANGGSIVNIASIAGVVGEPSGAAAYNASKGAVRLLTKSAAMHCAQAGFDVRVNAVCPGYVETNITGQSPEASKAYWDMIRTQVPMGRIAQPVEIANAVLFLASDEASYMTGADLLVDGGFTAR